MQAYEGAVYRKGQFQSQANQCAATLHMPKSGIGPYPAILMVHGWGGIQLMLIKEYIRHFNALGCVVMTFDYPGWGDSEGLPRNCVNPWKRVQTAESALAFLKAQPEVDASRIMLWGSSFGGGHVVDLAAEHPELLGAIAQVPMLDGREAVKAVPVKRMLRFGLDITRDLMNPFTTHYLPVVSRPGHYSSMDSDGAYRAQEWLDTNLSQRYDNRVAAASMMWMAFYRPFRNLRRIRIPTLIIGAKRDSVAPFNEAAVRRHASVMTEIQVLDANHFDPYLDPYFSINIESQNAFIEEQLAS